MNEINTENLKLYISIDNGETFEPVGCPVELTIALCDDKDVKYETDMCNNQSIELSIGCTTPSRRIKKILFAATVAYKPWVRLKWNNHRGRLRAKVFYSIFG